MSNELGCHNVYDFSDDAAGAFRTWLRDRYATLDALNAAWGTAFWSQRYSDWDQVLPPRLAASHPNPTQQLDFEGALLLDAPLSKTTTGFKSLLLKVLDPLFRKSGAGTMLPIVVSGTVSKPSFGLDKGRLIGR